MAKRGTKATEGTKVAQRGRQSFASLESLSSSSETAPDKFILPHGGYQDLLSYQKALIVYDATLHFYSCFFSKFDRTREQMIQAARSGKQNILEGSEASGTSKETEIKLTNTARASLKEPLEDYRDFMRNRGMTSGFLAVTFVGSLSELRERYCQPSKSTWDSRSVCHASSTAGLKVTTSTRLALSFLAS